MLFSTCIQGCLQHHRKPDSVFLTPNTRLTAQLQNLLDSAISDQSGNCSGWSTPVVMPFEQWFEQKRKTALLCGEVQPRQLLTATEEQVIWHEVASQSVLAKTLLAVSAAVSEVQKAYALVREWLLDMDSYRFAFESLPDSQLLYAWMQSLSDLLQSRNLVTRADAKLELLNVSNPAQENILLVGFEKLTPLQTALVEKYSGDEPYQQLSLARDCEQLNVARAEDFDQEIVAAAHWAQSLQQQEPEAKIAIVVKDLTQQKLKVERILRQVFISGKGCSIALKQQLFNVSAGLSLASTAVGKTFLDLLECLQHPLPIGRWQRLLNSPYFLFQQPGNPVLSTALVKAMYLSGEKKFELLELPRLLNWAISQQQPEPDISQWPGYAELQTAIEQLRGLSRRSRRHSAQLPSLWLSELQAIAVSLGWLGGRTLDSDEYQQWNKLQQCLESFRRFDAVLGPVTIGRAYNAFVQHCRGAIYHPESTTDSAVPQVLGLLEASGQLFDHLWITGLSDRQWPMMVSPNPMIPEFIQIEQQMPSASVEGELAYATSMSSGLLCAARTIVLSYPARLDEAETQLSPLLESLIQKLQGAEVERGHCSDYFGTDDQRAESESSVSPFEFIPDIYGQPLAEAPRCDSNDCSEVYDDSVTPRLPGGAGMLKAIASNPLVAYLRWRLQVEPLPQPVDGISPLERGNLLHALLEAVWRQLEDRQALDAHSEDTLQALLQQQLNDQQKRIFAKRYRQPGMCLLELECRAVQQIASEWLKLESERPEFSVCALEKKIAIVISGYQIRGRIDRIDRIADKEYLIVDYKSGQFRASAMLETPLYEPQLPLYLLALQVLDEQSHVTGLAFAGLKPGYLKLQGYGCASALQISGMATTVTSEEHGELESWQSLQQHWQHELESLVDKATQGYAAVQPGIHGQNALYEPFLRMQFADESAQTAEKSSAGSN